MNMKNCAFQPFQLCWSQGNSGASHHHWSYLHLANEFHRDVSNNQAIQSNRRWFFSLMIFIHIDNSWKATIPQRRALTRRFTKLATDRLKFDGKFAVVSPEPAQGLYLRRDPVGIHFNQPINLSINSMGYLLAAFLFPLLISSARVYAAYGDFTDLDQVEDWKIERKISVDGEIKCRAYLPSGGTWFGANIHLDRSNHLVLPNGQELKSTTSIEKVINHLARCREDLLYLPIVED